MTDSIISKTVIIGSGGIRTEIHTATVADTDPSCIIHGEHRIRLVNERLNRIKNMPQHPCVCPFWAAHSYSNAEFEEYLKSLNQD